LTSKTPESAKAPPKAERKVGVSAIQSQAIKYANTGTRYRKLAAAEARIRENA
jgi:hypothetical protein